VLAFIIYAIRAFKGPTIVDIILAVDCMSFDIAAFMAIILAVDCMSFDIAAFMAILAIYFKSAFLISGAITLALWAYLLDIYIAKHLVGKEVGV